MACGNQRPLRDHVRRALAPGPGQTIAVRPPPEQCFGDWPHNPAARTPAMNAAGLINVMLASAGQSCNLAVRRKLRLIRRICQTPTSVALFSGQMP
jgi:hypothetical protein